MLIFLPLLCLVLTWLFVHFPIALILAIMLSLGIQAITRSTN